MAETQWGHLDQIRQHNALLVYRLIIEKGPISRIDLSRLSGLVPASITKIVRELMAVDLVIETMIPTSGHRGRPAVGVMVSDKQWHFLGISLQHNVLNLTLCTLTGQCLTKQHHRVDTFFYQQLSESLLNYIQQFFAHNFTKVGRMMAIAMIMDQDIPTSLADFLALHTGLSVYIERDVQARALAEIYLKDDQDKQNVLYLEFSPRLACSVFLSTTHGALQPDIAQLPINLPSNSTENQSLSLATFYYPELFANLLTQNIQPRDRQETSFVTFFSLAEREGVSREVTQMFIQTYAHLLASLHYCFKPELIIRVNDPLDAFPDLREQVFQRYQQLVKVNSAEIVSSHCQDELAVIFALIQREIKQGDLLTQLLAG